MRRSEQLGISLKDRSAAGVGRKPSRYSKVRSRNMESADVPASRSGVVFDKRVEEESCEDGIFRPIRIWNDDQTD